MARGSRKLRSMHQRYVFGYGSLVNRRTHVHHDAHPARLRGWRRAWRHAAVRPVSFLTVLPDPGAEIDGLIASVPEVDWAALDAREGAYDRVAVTDFDHPLPAAPEVSLYAIAVGRHAAPTHAAPVLMSYLDTVVQGFLTEFGEEGVARFFTSTDGWDAPIFDDRAAPRYARAAELSPDDRALVDGHLAALGAAIHKG